MLKIAVCDDEILQKLDIVNKIKGILESNYCNHKYDIEEFSNGEQMITPLEKLTMRMLVKRNQKSSMMYTT